MAGVDSGGASVNDDGSATTDGARQEQRGEGPKDRGGLGLPKCFEIQHLTALGPEGAIRMRSFAQNPLAGQGGAPPPANLGQAPGSCATSPGGRRGGF